VSNRYPLKSAVIHVQSTLHCSGSKSIQSKAILIWISKIQWTLIALTDQAAPFVLEYRCAGAADIFNCAGQKFSGAKHGQYQWGREPCRPPRHWQFCSPLLPAAGPRRSTTSTTSAIPSLITPPLFQFQHLGLNPLSETMLDKDGLAIRTSEKLNGILATAHTRGASPEPTTSCVRRRSRKAPCGTTTYQPVLYISEQRSDASNTCARGRRRARLAHELRLEPVPCLWNWRISP
jgi:hypothetical protein